MGILRRSDRRADAGASGTTIDATAAGVGHDDATRGRSARDVAARAVLMGLLSRMHNGALIIADGGRRSLCGKPVPGEAVPEISVHSPRVFGAVASEGSVGLGYAYVRGWWSCADLDDLTAFLRVVVRHLDGLERAGELSGRLWSPMRRALTRPAERPGNRDADRRNIHAHYDLGNEFFSLVLDETMTYSCALFSSPTEDLATAQRNKLERICAKLALSPADHLLEIGTGWGSLALYAASRYGCKVTTTTISDRQFELATARVKEAGLEDLVTVCNTDYRDLAGTFDKLVSIEMIEALDWRQYDTFFSKCSTLLEADGLMVLQAIVIADQHYERAKNSVDFIKAHVFPGSCIPSISAIVETTGRATDLRLVALDDIGNHYAETLRRWRSRLVAHAGELPSLGLDDAFRRLFEFYLCYCEAGFAERRISDVQCVFAKPGWRPGALCRPIA